MSVEQILQIEQILHGIIKIQLLSMIGKLSVGRILHSLILREFQIKMFINYLLMKVTLYKGGYCNSTVYFIFSLIYSARF